VGVGPPLLLDFDTPPQQAIQAITPHKPITNSAVLIRERKNILTPLTKKFDDSDISLRCSEVYSGLDWLPRLRWLDRKKPTTEARRHGEQLQQEQPQIDAEKPRSIQESSEGLPAKQLDDV
jgi:hypothetical protein